MTRSEAYTLVKAKLRRFCEATHEPSDAASRKLVWELNAIVDEVNTDSGPTLNDIKKKAFDALIETGLLVRKCRKCRDKVSVCFCIEYTGLSPRKRRTFLDLDRAALRRLESI